MRELDSNLTSAIVREVRLLSAGRRRILRITDRQLDIADLCFRAIRLMLDDRDSRPMWDRLEDLAVEIRDAVGPLDLETLDLDSDSEITLPYWLCRASDSEYRRFVRRLLGAAWCDRFAKALRQDAATIVVGLRRYLRYLLPVAAATDRCIRVLTPQQQARIEGIESLARSTALELVVQFDSLVPRLEAAGVRLDAGIARASELVDLPGPFRKFAHSMDIAVSDQSADIIEGLSASLTRKVKGARDALTFSADPVSQGANSLLELIDRVLRHAFAPEYVVEWIGSCFPAQRGQLTHVKQGKQWPTKKGQALCFVYAGEKPVDSTMVHQLIVEVIVAVRRKLERLKHADACTDAEREELVALLEAVEACFVLVSRVAWLCVEESTLGDLRDRLVLVS